MDLYRNLSGPRWHKNSLSASLVETFLFVTSKPHTIKSYTNKLLNHRKNKKSIFL